MTEPPRLRAAGLTRRFGPLVANDAVDLDLHAGQIHALVGENGAGKSTLMSLLYGLQRPDDGHIESRGERVAYASPRDAIADGVGMVHQHFQLFDSLSVADNVVYGAEPVRAGGIIDRRRARAEVAELITGYGSHLPVDATVGELPMGLRQQVEILKALYRGADVLILDEPTAVLTPAETDLLFTSLRRLAAGGAVVVLVTHKLDEVMAVSSWVTVMRRGAVVASLPTAETSAAALAEAMTGRSIVPVTNESETAATETVLTLTDLRVTADGARTEIRVEELTVCRGEIVGIAGVTGNGQSEVVQAVVGLRPCRGAVSLNGVRVDGLDVRRRRGAGIAYVPEDRRGVGTAPQLSIADNVAVGQRRGFGWLSPRRSGAAAHRLIERHDVRGGGPGTPVAALSGGNAQKVVIARELGHDADLLIAENPTQGVDIGAIEYIHGELLAYRNRGRSVLLVSNELTELCALADRVYVMVDGRVVAEIPRSGMSEQSIGAAMTNAGDRHAG
ncbi:ABC transporter ATP-binding protein [Actinoplanes sp. NPDC051851]|uniref:ABC transporter ATP-binding protein n=1 Tax=Actinoplanes sp. NPDC051851 TaxID=3154753 RepID=UPI00341F1DDB